MDMQDCNYLNGCFSCLESGAEAWVTILNGTHCCSFALEYLDAGITKAVFEVGRCPPAPVLVPAGVSTLWILAIALLIIGVLMVGSCVYVRREKVGRFAVRFHRDRIGISQDMGETGPVASEISVKLVPSYSENSEASSDEIDYANHGGAALNDSARAGGSDISVECIELYEI